MSAIRPGGRYAVVGLGMSGRAVIRYLNAEGASAVGYDRQTADALDEGASGLPPGTEVVAGPDYLERLDRGLQALDGLFVTPGMPKDLPVLRHATEMGIPLLGEAAVVLQYAPLPVIGITGSAGKTTTTTLVGAVVQRVCPGSLVGGNIGLPLIDRLQEMRRGSGAWLVMELSSFQLELANSSPAVACLLNLRPNHLDIHGSFQAYRDAKRRIYRFQGPQDVAIFGIDDPVVAALAAEAPGRVLRFSRLGEVAAGAAISGGYLWWIPPDGQQPVPVLTTDELPLPGEHNVDNVLAAIAVCGAAGMPMSVVAEVVLGFTGIEHRLELVRQVGGQRWINDSIATAPDRTMAALRTFPGQRIVLLAGGYDKHLPLETLAQEIAQRVEHLIVYGASADRIAQAVRSALTEGHALQIEHACDLEDAVHRADAVRCSGRIVLLSPASASYDQFRNFEERGRRFKELVAALPE